MLGFIGLLGACAAPVEGPVGANDEMGATSGAEGPVDGSSGAPEGDDGGAGSTGDDSATGGDPSAGLPCEVDAILAQTCRTCHGDPPNGAPFSLVSLADLVAPSISDPNRTVAEVALERMRSQDNPMPPAPGTPVDAASVEVFEAWVADGSPASEVSCEGKEDEPSPFGDPPVCSSGEFRPFDDDDDDDDDDDAVYPRDDDGSPLMAPGRACLDCHDEERADGDDDVPNLLFAGTAYPTGHEPDECIGAQAEGAEVHVQGANGDEVVVTINASGNFMLFRSDAPDGFGPPYRVKVVSADGERLMPIEAPNGDCNGCHTQFGDNGAPGRIVLP